MDSERPPSSRVDAFSGSAIVTARGTLREALGAVRNLAQLLHSLRVAPKSLSQVLPDVLEACEPMRESMQILLAAIGEGPTLDPARAALEEFVNPRIGELEAALSVAMTRPLNARSRLALEEVVSNASFQLEGARALLQLLEDAICERNVRLDPRELVREAFTAPESSRPGGKPVITATLSDNVCGYEIALNPRVTMTLVSLGVELVASRSGEEKPTIIVSSDGRATCTIRIVRQPQTTGESLVLTRLGIFEPTLPCLRAAATLTRGHIEWNPSTEEFSLSYPIDGDAAYAC